MRGWKCHNYTDEEKAWSKANSNNNYQEMCEHFGGLYSKGSDKPLPGCGTCGCCKPHEGVLEWGEVGVNFSHIAVGKLGVWGIKPDHKIFYRKDGKWVSYPGALTSISVGRTQMWGVNRGGIVFMRTVAKGLAKGWKRVAGILKQVSVSNNDHVWGIKPTGNILRRIEGSWRKMPGIMTQVDVGPSGVWAVKKTGDIFYRSGTYGDKDIGGSSWVKIPEKLKWITSGKDIVFGVNFDDEIFYREGITASSPTGTRWVKLNGTLAQIDVNGNSLFGVNSANNLYQAAWSVDGSFKAETEPYHACDNVTDGHAAAAAICDALKGAPFSSCHSTVDFGGSEGGLYRNCMTDVCQCSLDTICACSQYDNYASTCIDAGVDISNWTQSIVSCPYECPEGFTYKAAGAIPSPTCLIKTPEQEGTVRGCFCPSGKYLQDGVCVVSSECKCLYEGSFYDNGAMIEKPSELGCETCSCGNAGEMACSTLSCPDPPEPYHPCDNVTDGHAAAATICDALKGAPFSSCHSIVDYYYCPYECPEGFTYKAAAAIPSPTCLISTPTQEGTTGGCFCPSGKYLQEGVCVAASECKCLYEGSFYDNGATIEKPSECETCFCGNAGVLTCSTLASSECKCLYEGSFYDNRATIEKSSESECETCSCGNAGELTCSTLICPDVNCIEGEFLVTKDHDCCPYYYCDANWVVAFNPEVSLKEGQGVVLTCQVNALATKINKISWYKDGVEVTKGVANNKLSLNISGVGAKDAGTYECVAEKDGTTGKAEFDVEVVVIDLTFTTKKSKVSCQEGKKVCKIEFSVKKASGEKLDKKYVKICKLDAGVPTDCKNVKGKPKKGKFEITFKGKFEITFKKPSRAVAGKYVCVITQDGKETVSDPVTVTVKKMK